MKKTYFVPTTAEEVLIAETRLMQEEAQSSMIPSPPAPPMSSAPAHGL